ncbi:MAG: disulfide bond formation protein DsbA [Parcubacteria group bacterium]|jgi:protein-disulfide isomerase|nr:disulfide bond formation protein DsbA [Parcubacteria group bacterium]
MTIRMKLEFKLNTLILPVAVLVAAILISGSLLWSSNRASAAAIAANTPPGAQAPSIPVDSNKVVTDNEPYVGDQNAPITIAYWFDYQCPFCHQDEETVIPTLIQQYVDTGKVKIVFKDFQFLGADSTTLGEVARAVWEVSPNQFYAWHKAMFDAQGTENTGWATPEKIKSVTTNILGAATADKVLALSVSKAATYQQEMQADQTEAENFGVNGTPSMIIGKQIIVGAQPIAQFEAAIAAASK